MDSAAAAIQAQELGAEAVKDDPRAKARYEDFSVWSDILGFLPDNVKGYIKYNLGLGKDLSELDLNEKTLNYLDYLAFGGGAADPNRIDYEDYGLEFYSKVSRDPINLIINDQKKRFNRDVTREDILTNPDDYTIYDGSKKEVITVKQAMEMYPGAFDPKGLGIGAFTDPATITGTFIGRADIVRDENGNVIIQDRYDFNELEDTPENVEGVRKQYRETPLGEKPFYESGRRLPAFNPFGQPYGINVNLGREEDFIKRQGLTYGGKPLMKLKYRD